MSVKVKYEVVRQFKYGDKILKIGDEFVPGGGKWDVQLVSDTSKYIRQVEMKPIPKRRGRTKKVSDK